MWLGLPKEAWQEAFDSHPRIGEQEAAKATGSSLSWSAREQSEASAADEAVKLALAEANRRYEAKFERIFIVCANGQSAEKILEVLEKRMLYAPEVELREAVEQQRRITQLRLERWLGGTR